MALFKSIQGWLLRRRATPQHELFIASQKALNEIADYADQHFERSYLAVFATDMHCGPAAHAMLKHLAHIRHNDLPRFRFAKLQGHFAVQDVVTKRLYDIECFQGVWAREDLPYFRRQRVLTRVARNASPDDFQAIFQHVRLRYAERWRDQVDQYTRAFPELLTQMNSPEAPIARKHPGNLQRL